MEMLPPPTVQSAPSPTRLELRELTREEVLSLEPIFKGTGNPLPDPAISTFVGAVENGEVIAFIVLQLKLHAQPAWIKEGHSNLFESLIHLAENTILKRCGPQWVYLFVPAGRLSQLAQHMGMQLEPWNVLSKLVMPEVPSKADPMLIPLEEIPAEGVVQ